MKIASVTITNSTAGVIADALASVVAHVDTVILVDTGITDDTVAVARRVAGDKLRVYSHTWKDFSAARNFAVDCAREDGADWALIVDSDERLVWNGVSLRDALAAMPGVNTVLVGAADGTYCKWKAVRPTSGVRFVGPTHEVPLGGPDGVLEGPVFTELPKTPAQVAYKLSRDYELLTAYTHEHPADARWFYYLGDTADNLGKAEEAVAAFRRCLELRRCGDEEGAWAAYRAGYRLSVLGRHDEVVDVCCQGLSRYGTAELAWLAGQSAYRLGRRQQCADYARVAVALGRYAGVCPPRWLFTNPEALWELPYDLLRYALPDGPERDAAEAEFHKAKRARLFGAGGKEDLDRASVSRAPGCHDARRMLRPRALRYAVKARTVMVDPVERPANYHACNPSLCKHGGKLWLAVRLVNYVIENGQYVVSDADGKVRTETLFGRWDPGKYDRALDLSVVADREGAPRVDANVLGYEDVRPFAVRVAEGELLLASATALDRVAGRHTVVLMEIDEAGDCVKTHLELTDRPVEKNWMPVEGGVGGEPAWLYSVDPTVLRVGREQRPVGMPALALDHLRGGSQVVRWGDRWLCVTHETISQDGWGVRRIYLHRFVELDAEWRVARVSPAFVFEDGHYGIEFCAGLCLWDGDVLLSYGVEDREAKVLVVGQEELKRWADRTWHKA